MSGVDISIALRGLDRARRVARWLVNLGEDTTPLLAILGSAMVQSTVGRFETGRGPGGIPWAPTKRQRRSAVGPSGPNKARILVDTGELQDSIDYEISPGQVEWGSDGLGNPIKAIANQFGAHGTSYVLRHTRTVTSAFGVPLPGGARVVGVDSYDRINNLPARPFIGVDDADIAEVEDRWQEYITVEVLKI